MILNDAIDQKEKLRLSGAECNELHHHIRTIVLVVTIQKLDGLVSLSV